MHKPSIGLRRLIQTGVFVGALTASVAGAAADTIKVGIPVSYTHLTLPTIYSV